jgi:hypothetical protein
MNRKNIRPYNWAPGVTVRHRSELDAVQRELREIKAFPR